MRELPILFSTPMVQSILDGRKSMTRRIIKPSVVDKFNLNPSGKLLGSFSEEVGDIYPTVDDCQYQPGDYLWVRETWTKYYYSDENGYTHYDQPMIYYAADGEPDFRIVDGDGFEVDDQRIKWKPSIHMPKSAARIWLEVTDVRVERLQDITEADAITEGIENGQLYYYGEPHAIKGSPKCCNTAKEAFKGLWNSLNAKRGYGWDTNPWVWVISFRRINL